MESAEVEVDGVRRNRRRWSQQEKQKVMESAREIDGVAEVEMGGISKRNRG